MIDLYLWAKALHVIAVFAWMAGLFYLPRLFVYHAGQGHGGDVSALLAVMERRLLKVIMRPAAVASWVFGAVTLWLGELFPLPPWLVAKLVLVLVLSAFHGLLEYHQREFAVGRSSHGEGYFRIINEAPTLLLAGIVILVIVRPF